MAMQRMAHPEGELAVARAAAHAGVGHVSTLSISLTCWPLVLSSGPESFALLWQLGRKWRCRELGFTCSLLPYEFNELQYCSKCINKRLGALELTGVLCGAQVQSTMGTVGLEDVARAAAGSPWLVFQLYVLSSRDFTRGLVQRALCLLWTQEQKQGVGFQRELNLARFQLHVLSSCDCVLLSLGFIGRLA